MPMRDADTDGYDYRDLPDEDEQDEQDKREDTGRYENGYRIYRDGSYREDFGSDR